MEKRGTRALTLKVNIKKFSLKSKRSQATIFIIAGLIVIGVIALFFIFKGGIPGKIGGKEEASPEKFLFSCINDKVKDAVDLLLSQGGHISPVIYKTFMFEDEGYYTNISYLCYTRNYYVSCINQEPMLIQHIKEEIKDYINEDVENCFSELKLSLEKQGYEVTSEYNGFEVELMPRRVSINIDGKITLTKTEETSSKENFEIAIPTRLYDLARVVQEITSQEGEYCNFEHLGYMLLNPEFNIDKFRTSDLSTIYTVQHKDSEEKFRFAVRSCVIPPGI